MIRRFLTRVLMVILIAVCGYNGWQIHQMQGEIVLLQAETNAVHRAGTKPPASADDPATRSWLDQADVHAGHAQAAIERGDFNAAQHELTAGVNDVHHAVQEPEKKTQATLDQARRTLASLQAQAGSLWRKLHSVQPGFGR